MIAWSRDGMSVMPACTSLHATAQNRGRVAWPQSRSQERCSLAGCRDRRFARLVNPYELHELVAARLVWRDDAFRPQVLHHLLVGVIRCADLAHGRQARLERFD